MRRIVIQLQSGIGDDIMAIPLLRACKNGLQPNDKLIILASSAIHKTLLESAIGPHSRIEIVCVGHIWPGSKLGFLKLGAQLRRLRPSVFLMPQSTSRLRVTAFALLVNAPTTVLPDSALNRLLFRETVTKRAEHKVAEYVRFGALARLGTDADPRPGISIPAERLREARSVLGDGKTGAKWIGFAPGSGILETHKRWPVAHWRSLAETLLKKGPELNIAIIGGPSETDLINAIGNGLTAYGNRVALIADPDVMVTAGVLRHCDCVVSACSGTLHLAAAVGTPVVGLYGPTNPGFTGPYSEKVRIVRLGLACSPCYRLGFSGGCGDPVCMSMLEPSLVERELMSALRGEFTTPMSWHQTTDAVRPNTRRHVQNAVFQSHARDVSVPAPLVRPTPSSAKTSRPYQICTNCVMDTTDTKIVFDTKGVCDHCNTFYTRTLPSWHPDETGRRELERLVAQIREAGKGNDYDCILGISGGVDSSYLAYVARKHLGLRPLLFHVDAGWNTQEAVNNIEQLVDKLGLELFTEVIDWEEMRDLKLAYFKAGVPQIDAPQDFAFFYTMYKYANKYDIKFILTGANLSTECIRNPVEWSYYGDSIQMRDIHARFGGTPLRTFPTTHILWQKLYLRYLKRVRVVRPLNYVPYIKADAVKLLMGELGWQAYPQKHFESRFTKFVEGYWLPTRFGYDTRRVQYSSLILTNQLTREEALKKLQTPVYDAESIRKDCEYVATKLGISVDELHGYLIAPTKSFKDYKSQEWLFRVGAAVLKGLKVEIGGKR